MGHVIGESCFKGTILQRNYRKMTMSFSYNSFVKFHGKIFWEPQHDRVFYNKFCYKGTALYFLVLLSVLLLQVCFLFGIFVFSRFGICPD